MKINKEDLKQIIKEEAFRLFQIEKLEEAKKAVDEEIRLISEGKKKLTEEEMEELFGGLGAVMKAGASKVGQIAGKVADTYKKGETEAKIASLTKQQADLNAKLKSVNDELAKLSPAPAAKTGAKTAKPASKMTAKPAAGRVKKS